ncbi:hypothetical protein M9Y10_024003 [Tritrichomonas musculus]|uniref:Uncharacterized protein n=1 Tax=Tritrichomonas musculus TaxID=1915356 RepID=A0ABR2KXJ9_9EUKA
MPPQKHSIRIIIRSAHQNNSEINRTFGRLNQATQQQMEQPRPKQLQIQQQLQAIQQQLQIILQKLQVIQQKLMVIQQQLGSQHPEQPPIQQQQQQQGQPALMQNILTMMINEGIAKDKVESNDYQEFKSCQYIKKNFINFRFAQIKLFLNHI